MSHFICSKGDFFDKNDYFTIFYLFAIKYGFYKLTFVLHEELQKGFENGGIPETCCHQLTKKMKLTNAYLSTTTCIKVSLTISISNALPKPIT